MTEQLIKFNCLVCHKAIRTQLPYSVKEQTCVECREVKAKRKLLANE